MKREQIPKDPIADVCRRHHIAQLWLFGSALREDFHPESDIDLLVEFDPETPLSMSGLLDVEEALSPLFGNRKIDLVLRRSLERNPNHIRRQNILDSLEKLFDEHAAG